MPASDSCAIFFAGTDSTENMYLQQDSHRETLEQDLIQRLQEDQIGLGSHYGVRVHGWCREQL